MHPHRVSFVTAQEVRANKLMMEDNIPKGIAVMLLTSLFASIVAAGTRYLSAYFPIHIIICGQYFTGLLITGAILIPRGTSGFVTTRWGLHLFRGFSGLAALYTFYYSLIHIQLVEATLLRSAAPLCVPIILQVWLKVKIPSRRWLPLFIGFVGVMVILRPTPDNFSVWHLLAFISAVMVGCSMVSTRLLVYTETSTAVIFYYYVIATIASLPLAVKSFCPAPWYVWFVLATTGVGLYLAMSFYTMSFRYAKPSVISPVSFFGVVFAGFWGWLFWNQVPVIWTYLGVLLVAVGAILILLQEGPDSPVIAGPGS